MKNDVKLFGQQKVRTHWDEKAEKWYFSIIDVIEILTGTGRNWGEVKNGYSKE
jgi:DNA-damage-inducible protein D